MAWKTIVSGPVSFGETLYDLMSVLVPCQVIANGWRRGIFKTGDFMRILPLTTAPPSAPKVAVFAPSVG